MSSTFALPNMTILCTSFSVCKKPIISSMVELHPDRGTQIKKRETFFIVVEKLRLKPATSTIGSIALRLILSQAHRHIHCRFSGASVGYKSL